MAQYVHIGDVVKELGLSKDTWRRLADSGRVRAVRLNGPRSARVFDMASCRALLEQEEPVRKVLEVTPLREHMRQFRAGRPTG